MGKKRAFNIPKKALNIQRGVSPHRKRGSSISTTKANLISATGTL